MSGGLLPGRRKRSFLGLFLGGFLVLTIAVTLAIFYVFSVSGIEFSPQTFERRRFSYIRLPLIGRQLTGIVHTAIETPLEERLIADKLITPQPKNQTWDCVELTSGSAVTYGDAKILTDYLDSNGKADLRLWLDWSEKHPECAKVFWPVVMQTAEEGRYLIMPELFTAARGGQEDKPEALAETLKQIRIAGYRPAAE